MRRPVLLVAASALVATAVYLPSLRAGFVWDDRSLIVENRYLDDWSRWRANLGGDFFRRSATDERIGHWRPVVTLSYMLDKAAFGERAWGFHLVNVALHAAASALLALLTLRLGLGAVAAGAAGLLFAVHPVHVESVAWISGRTDLWCGLLVLAALVLDAGQARRPSTIRGLLSGIATLLALLAKEMAIVVPFAVALRALLLPGEYEARRSPGRRVPLAALPHVVALVLYAVLRFGVIGIAPVPPLAAAVGRTTLFWTWWSGFVEYVRVLIWPARLDIVPPVELLASPVQLRVVLGIALVVSLVVLAWRAYPRVPALTFSIATFLVALVPLTNFIVAVRAPASIPFPWAERFLYVPSIAFCLAVGVTAGLSGRGRFPRIPRGLLSAVGVVALLSCSARTIARTEDWRDDRSLFASSARRSPGTAWVRVGLGTALLESGDPAGAERELREALRLTPDNTIALHNLGNILAARGDLAGAETLYREALRLRPNDTSTLVNLALALEGQDRTGDALALVERADALTPGLPEVKINRANLLRRLDRSSAAVPFYEEALRLRPGYVPALVGLAGARLETGDPAAAERLAREAVSRQPSLVAARVVLAAALDRQGRREEAEAAWAEVLRLDPAHQAARRRVAPPLSRP